MVFPHGLFSSIKRKTEDAHPPSCRGFAMEWIHASRSRLGLTQAGQRRDEWHPPGAWICTSMKLSGMSEIGVRERYRPEHATSCGERSLLVCIGEIGEYSVAVPYDLDRLHVPK
jgi:hypothetical protein